MALLIPDESSLIFVHSKKFSSFTNAAGYYPGYVTPSTADPAPFPHQAVNNPLGVVQGTLLKFLRPEFVKCTYLVCKTDKTSFKIASNQL